MIDTKTKTLKDIPTGFTVIDSILSSTQGSDDILLLGVGSYNLPHEYISYNLRTNTYEVLMKSSSVAVPNGYISKPQPLTFKTTGGHGNNYARNIKRTERVAFGMTDSHASFVL